MVDTAVRRFVFITGLAVAGRCFTCRIVDQNTGNGVMTAGAVIMDLRVARINQGQARMAGTALGIRYGNDARMVRRIAPDCPAVSMT